MIRFLLILYYVGVLILRNACSITYFRVLSAVPMRGAHKGSASSYHCSSYQESDLIAALFRVDWQSPVLIIQHDSWHYSNLTRVFSEDR